jgi:deoxyribodipyrimidine photolyase-related protein
MDKHREQLSRNHRLGMLFGSWDKLAADEREAVLETARRNLIRIESL